MFFTSAAQELHLTACGSVLLQWNAQQAGGLMPARPLPGIRQCCMYSEKGAGWKTQRLEEKHTWTDNARISRHRSNFQTSNNLRICHKVSLVIFFQKQKRAKFS